MNREEEFEKAASEYAQYEVWGSSYDDVWEGFVDGAKWADEHTATLWHSVKDGELPQAGKNCIFSYQGKIYKGFMYEDGALHFEDEFSPMIDINEVDYWMEIPELPTE